MNQLEAREVFMGGTVDLEKSLIGAVIVNPDLLNEVPWLAIDHFAHMPCRWAWEAIRNIEAAGQPIDIVTLEAELERASRLQAMAGSGTDGSLAGIAELGLWVTSMPSAENAVAYAQQIREHALHRRVLIELGNAKARADKGTAYGIDLLGDLLGVLSKIDADDVKDESRNIGELSREHVKFLEAEAARRLAGKVELTGFPTGVGGLDDEIGGWQPGIVSVICARPGHGKSSLGLATADASSAAGHGVHVFSLEDPRRMYMNRVIARLSEIPINRIATVDFQRQHFAMFSKAQNELVKKGRPWIVDDRSGITSDDIIRSVRRHRKANNTKVVIVDYVQLIRQSRNSFAKSRHETISELFNELADAAKNDGMAYVIMSQLNRDVEKRDDKRPQQQDLRESGTLEERAKTIVALYRGPKYSPTPQPDIDVGEDGNIMDSATYARSVQLLVLKNSQGPSPVRVLARWDGETTTVS
jgi:replicative DNA helicase